MTERMIQRGIMDYLTMIQRQRKVYWFRAGSGVVKTESGRYFRSGKPGVPDIVCCVDGRWIGLEVKTAKGRQSPAQKRAEQEIIAAGGEYHVVRSISDVKAIIPPA